MRSGLVTRSKRTAVAAVVALVGLGVPATGTAGAAGVGSKFENGNWNLFFSATLKCAPQQGQLGLGGHGTFEVLKGNITGPSKPPVPAGAP